MIKWTQQSQHMIHKVSRVALCTNRNPWAVASCSKEIWLAHFQWSWICIGGTFPFDVSGKSFNRMDFMKHQYQILCCQGPVYVSVLHLECHYYDWTKKLDQMQSNTPKHFYQPWFIRWLALYRLRNTVCWCCWNVSSVCRWSLERLLWTGWRTAFQKSWTGFNVFIEHK